MLEMTAGVNTGDDEQAADVHDPARCVDGLQAALQTMVDEGSPTNASAAFTILLSLERHGPALDAKQFLAVYQSIDRANERSRTLPGSWYDSPDRVQWRAILLRSRECLMALTRAWRSAVKDRSPRPVGGPTAPSSRSR